MDYLTHRLKGVPLNDILDRYIKMNSLSLDKITEPSQDLCEEIKIEENDGCKEKYNYRF